MSNDEQWENVARRLLRMCKTIDPTFWGEERQQLMVKGWAITLAGSNLPVKAIYAAPAEYYRRNSTGERPSLGQLITAARNWQQKYELTPEGKNAAKQLREKRRQEIDEAIKNGTWTPKGM